MNIRILHFYFCVCNLISFLVQPNAKYATVEMNFIRIISVKFKIPELAYYIVKYSFELFV